MFCFKKKRIKSITISLFMMLFVVLISMPDESSAWFYRNDSDKIAKERPVYSGEYEIVFTATSSVAKKTQAKPALKKPPAIGGGIGKPGPILSKTKVVNGKRMCKAENDHPQKSKKNRPGHIDGECCLDTDETPNSNCYYPQARYSKLMKKYINKTNKK